MTLEKFAAIDFETANQELTSVCSVGVVIVENGEIVDKIYNLIKPEPNYYYYWNTRVHGLTRRDSDTAAPFSVVWAEIADKIEDIPLFAHNKSFDERCLKACCKMYRIDYPDYKFSCTYQLSRKRFPQLVNHRLHTVAQFVGFDLQNHHHALADAEACAAIVKALYGIK